MTPDSSPSRHVGDVVLLLFGLILIAGAIGTVAEHHGAFWYAAAVIEALVGVAFLWPREWLRNGGGR